MKIGLMFIIFLISAYFVSGEIATLNTIQDSYNFNEKVPLQLGLNYKEETSGYVKLNIDCNSKKLDYYMSPFEFTISQKQLTIPELTLTKEMLGKCSLNAVILDLNNNLLDQTLIKVFDVTDKLNLNVNLEKSQIDPGTSLFLVGSVKNIRNLEIKKSLLTVTSENKPYVFSLDLSDFKKEIPIDSKIKSGKHVIKIEVKDDNGNKAETTLEYNIIPKPSELKNLMNKLEFLPGEKVEVSSLLYDQANDLMENKAEIKLYNPKNEYITQGYGKIEYLLSQDSLPGSWIIKTSDSGFNIESRLLVKEVKKADFYVEEGVLYIKNIGNIDYNDNLKININGEEFIKKVSIDTNKLDKIDLTKETSPGRYDVSVESSNEEKEFPKIEIPKSKDPLYLMGLAIKGTANDIVDKPYILVIFLVTVIIVVFVVNRNKKIGKMNREREFELGNTRMQYIRKEKESQGIFKPKKFSELSNEELGDYRKQILKNMKEEKKDEESGREYKSPRDKGGGLFSMFN